mmetsp:Transcript_9205/g.27721  ORF Transcript_9205/g.27721 Transcript_9205/m.27721 type:complete len:364 (-) Transcript_9205:727-1818(-)
MILARIARQKLFYGAAVGCLSASAGSAYAYAASTTSIPEIVYIAETASRSAEAEASSLKKLNSKFNPTSRSDVDARVSAAQTALEDAKSQLASVKPAEESILFRVGLAAAVIGVSAGIMYKQSDDVSDDVNSANLENIIAAWISTSSPSLAVSFVAASLVALVANWRDVCGRDILSSVRNAATSLLQSRESDPRARVNMLVEEGYQRAKDLNRQTEKDLTEYENVKKSGAPLETKSVLAMYETRIKEARRDSLKFGEQVYKYRLRETAADVESAANTLHRRARNLKEREADSSFWDFLVGITAVLCGGGSTVAAAISWAAAVPFTNGVLRAFYRDSRTSLTEMRREAEALELRLNSAKHDGTR